MKNEVTQLLIDLKGSNCESINQLVPLVYDELLRIARRQLSRERRDQTLDSVALVNEAYLKLVHQDKLTWKNKAHFYAIAARTMRTILIDYARSQHAVKRGGGKKPQPIDDISFKLTNQNSEQLVALDEALKKLEKVNESAAKLVEHWYFGGLTLRESATVLNLSFATARRRWEFAKAWLKNELSEGR